MKHHDLLIVGAGIVGTFSAYHARKMGLSVALLEAGTEPSGATVRNFGQIVPSGQSIGSWREFGIRSLELYREVHVKNPLPIDQNGSLYVASDAAEEQLLDELHEIDKAGGYVSQRVTTDSMLQRVPTLRADYARSGLFYPQEITADSPNLLAPMLKLLDEDADFIYLPGTRVTGIDSHAGIHRVRTSRELSLSANRVLICCGHELQGTLPVEWFGEDLEISRLQMMSSAPLTDFKLVGNLLTGLTIRRYEAFHACPSYGSLSTPEQYAELEELGIHLLLTRRPDGSLIIGDSHTYHSLEEVNSLPYRVDNAINELIIAEMKRVLDVPGLTIKEAWNGFYSQSKSRSVYAKSLEGGMHILTGFGGKGMSTAPGVTEAAMKKIVNDGDIGSIIRSTTDNDSQQLAV